MVVFSLLENYFRRIFYYFFSPSRYLLRPASFMLVTSWGEGWCHTWQWLSHTVCNVCFRKAGERRLFPVDGEPAKTLSLSPSIWPGLQPRHFFIFFIFWHVFIYLYSQRVQVTISVWLVDWLSIELVATQRREPATIPGSVNFELAMRTWAQDRQFVKISTSWRYSFTVK